MHDPLTGYIRAKAVCVFLNDHRFLAGEAFDPSSGEIFYCPPGGRIEFGESSESAIVREVKEELGADIVHTRLLGVLENLFVFDGKQGHEIVFVYDAQFLDRSFYEAGVIEGRESNGIQFNAVWLDLREAGKDVPPVYPDGLVDLLRSFLAEHGKG